MAYKTDDKTIADIEKCINQDIEDAILGSIMGFATTEQEATSICLEDINKMCAEYGRHHYTCGFSMGYKQQEMDPNLYDMEFEMKFLDFKDVLKEPDALTPEAKYDMAMKAVI